MSWGNAAPAKAVLPKSIMLVTERDRCIRLIETMAARTIDGDWSEDEVSRLHAKHLNHHLTQFGV